MKIKEYLPLVLVLSVILLLDALWFLMGNDFSWMDYMRGFMGLFFVFFGFFKLLDWSGFVMAFAEYDVMASRFKFYAWLYPLVELFLGFAYLLSWQLVTVNIATAVIMFVGSIGVIKAVSSERKIRCACLGTVVKLPMSTVTIIENVGMGLMAVAMLISIFP